MTQFKRVLASCAIVATLAFGAGFAEEAPKPDRIKDCPVGLVCFTIEQAHEIDLKLINLRKDLEIEKARARGPKVCVGAGMGLSLDPFDGEFKPSGGLYVTYGFAIRRIPFITP